MSPNQPQELPKQPIAGIKNLIAVGSGKGGVGKTTVAVNLAIALLRAGNKVGLMDADVYGPNVPLMLGINRPPQATPEQRIIPLEKQGPHGGNALKLISMGFLNPGDKPLVWRGPMLHNVIQQFLRQTDWGELDYLIIDLPPGTGDVQLSLIQTTAISGAVIVTTPSEVALEDARKAVNMFRQVRTDIIGVVENMSGGVFGTGGGKLTAESMRIPFLGELPLDAKIRIGGDSGAPVAWEPGSPFDALAERIVAQLKALKPAGFSITVED